ncbi:MAG: transglutaminase-like domain-containing protein [Fimbriimonas sp.]
MISLLAIAAISAPAWHLEPAASRPFRITLTSEIRGQNVGADRMHLLVAVPPHTHEQPDVKQRVTLQVDGKPTEMRRSRDLTPMKREFLESRLRVTDATLRGGIRLTQEFSGTAKRYRLVAGPGPRLGKPLSRSEREFYTSTTESYDWKAPAFGDLLRANRLTWDRSAEDAVAFARRAYRFATGYCRYGKPKSDQLRDFLSTQQGECGDISIFFNAILRANGIPARCRVGRWIENGKGGDVGQSVHVRSEFYVDEVGWVPVDATAGLGAPEAESKQFGTNEGVDFLTLHLDPDLRVDSENGPAPIRLHWVQQVQVLLWGPAVDFSKLEHRERYALPGGA